MSDLEHVQRFVDDRREALFDLCAALVGERSVNPPGNTTGPARVLAQFLTGFGLASTIERRVDGKPNVVAQCEGRAPGRHLVFNGHLDTVSPGDESAWTVPVHTLTRRDGRLYGHGMGNMKGAVAALGLAYVYLATHPERWSGRLSLTAVADETVFGPDGAGYLLERRPDLLGDALVCGEGPGSMGLAIAEKGLYWVEIEARAAPGQGMTAERGSSANTRLAQAIVALDALNDERSTPPPEVACLAAHSGEHGLRVSVNTGVIAGGEFVSQAASRATARVDFRIPPGWTTAEVERHLERVAATVPGLAWRRIKGWDPNWTPLEAPVARCVAAAAGTVRGAPPPPVVRLPASDASRWRARGIPAVCYGPQPALASGVDDYALEQDVVDCAKVYALAALAYLAR